MLDEKDFLKNLYNDINNWLKFAETKNAAILTFNGLLLMSSIKLIQDTPEASFIYYALYVSVIIFLLNVILIITSFLPLFNASKSIHNNKPILGKKKLNLLYYKDLKKLNVEQYIELINETYGLRVEKENHYHHDLSMQVLTLSIISYEKYRIFTICSYITLIPLVFFFVFLVVKLV